MLFNQRKGRGRGRGGGGGNIPGRGASDARRRTNRPKWNAGKKNDDENEEKGADDNTYQESEERWEDKVSLLDANVSSQRYVVSSQSADPEAVTSIPLNLFQPDSVKLRQEMNYALKHLSLDNRYQIPSRLISTITGDEPDSDIQDESSTVVSALSSVTEKFRVANVLADPVASRLGILNLPSKPMMKASQHQKQSLKKSGRVSLLGIRTTPSMNTVDHSSKQTEICALQESKEMDTLEKTLDASSQANQEDEDPAADLIMRLRSLPSQDRNDMPLATTTSSNEEDIDEWLKETLNSKDKSSNVKVESKDNAAETFDEEHLEDWLDSII